MFINIAVVGIFLIGAPVFAQTAPATQGYADLYTELDPNSVEIRLNDNGTWKNDNVSILIDGKEVSRFFAIVDRDPGLIDQAARAITSTLTKAIFDAREKKKKFVLSRALIGNYGTLPIEGVINVGGAIVSRARQGSNRVLRDPNYLYVEAASSLFRGCGKVVLKGRYGSEVSQVRPERKRLRQIPCFSEEAKAIAAEFQRRIDQAKALGRPLVIDYGRLTSSLLVDSVLPTKDILDSLDVAKDEDFPELHVLSEASRKLAGMSGSSAPQAAKVSEADTKTVSTSTAVEATPQAPAPSSSAMAH